MAANALPRPRPTVKLERCWPWLERRGLQSTDTTVKTHVGRWFEKTGATRQADLVKIVAAYAAPLAG